MRQTIHPLALGVTALMVTGLLAGCTSTRQTRSSANLAEFLFPKGAPVERPPADQPVELEIPLRVGLLFVPSSTANAYATSYDLPPDVKAELLDQVKQAFQDRPFVKELTVIPESFLPRGQGLKGVKRVATSFGLDVVALIGYDQVQFSDASSRASVTYLTLVGAFLIPGQKNSTRTLMEASVFDVRTGSLLLHAQATDAGRSRSTLTKMEERLRTDSLESFRFSTEKLIADLDVQLDHFDDVVEAGEPVYGRPVKIARAGGSAPSGGGGGGGGGDLGAVGGALTLLLLGIAARPRLRRRA